MRVGDDVEDGVVDLCSVLLPALLGRLEEYMTTSATREFDAVTAIDRFVAGSLREVKCKDARSDVSND